VAARRRSRRRAGEHGDLKRTRAPGGDKDVISILRLAEEVTEGCCQGEVAFGRGASGERRLGVGAIPAKEGRGLDRIRSGS
jgi:hypothetical protein